MIQRKTGFKFLELIIVVAIIANLAVIFIDNHNEKVILPKAEQLADEVLKEVEARYENGETLDGFNCESYIGAKFNCSVEMHCTVADFKANNIAKTLLVEVGYKKKKSLTVKRYSKVVKTGHICIDD